MKPEHTKTLSRVPALFLVAFLFSLSACQSLKTRTEVNVDKFKTKTGREILTPIKEGGPQQLETEKPSLEGTPQESSSHEVTTEPPVQKPKKIGIILSGGGALTFGHLAFLKALQDQKIPLHAIAGIELSSPMAALYAYRQSSNEVEWQMYKLKDEDLVKKNLFGQNENYQSLQVLKEFSRSAFAGRSFANSEVPFFCAKFITTTAQVQIQTQGSLDKVLPGCTAYPPTFSVSEHEVAAVREVYGLAREMRKLGVERIVFVNVLSQKIKTSLKKDSVDELLWKEVQFEYSRVSNFVDEVVNIGVDSYDVLDFDKRREIQYKTSANLSKLMPDLARKWGY